MGKITVKHYLNTRVAPKKDERGNDTYPIFFMIIFNRMTIRKETIILRLFNRVTEEDFNNKTYSKIIKAGLNYELNLIYKIVEKFERRFSHKFQYSVRRIFRSNFQTAANMFGNKLTSVCDSICI